MPRYLLVLLIFFATLLNIRAADFSSLISSLIGLLIGIFLLMMETAQKQITCHCERPTGAWQSSPMHQIATSASGLLAMTNVNFQTASVNDRDEKCFLAFNSLGLIILAAASNTPYSLMGWIILMGVFPFGEWFLRMESIWVSVLWRFVIFTSAIKFLKPLAGPHGLGEKHIFILSLLSLLTFAVGGLGLWSAASIRRAFFKLCYSSGGILLLCIVGSIRSSGKFAPVYVANIVTIAVALCGIYALLRSGLKGKILWAAMLVFSLAIVGLPPSFGFVSRLGLFYSLAQIKGGYILILASAGWLLFLLGAIRFILRFKFDEADSGEANLLAQSTVAFCAIFQLVFFIFPNAILSICSRL